MTEEQRARIESWDKEQIYLAYLDQHQQVVNLSDALKRSEKNAANLRYDRDQFKEKWLRLHIEKHVSVEGDMQEALDYYFNHRERLYFQTKAGSYYCITIEEFGLSIMFAWYSGAGTKDKLEGVALLKSIKNTYGQPIYYTGTNNVMRNHSIDLGNGTYQLKL